MLLIADADLVLPDRILAGGAVAIEDGRIVEISEGRTPSSDGDVRLDRPKHYLLPGFVHVHVHGSQGIDTLDEGDAVAEIARMLPRFGVTSFFPTSVACDAGTLRRFLDGVRTVRTTPVSGSARVLPAHLESNFINPEYC